MSTLTERLLQMIRFHTILLLFNCCYALDLDQIIETAVVGVPSMSASWSVEREVGGDSQEAEKAKAMLAKGGVSEDRIEAVYKSIRNGSRVHFNVDFNYLSEHVYHISKKPLTGSGEHLEWHYTGDNVAYFVRHGAKIVSLIDGKDSFSLKRELAVGIPIFCAKWYIPALSTSSLINDKAGDFEYFGEADGGVRVSVTMSKDNLLIKKIIVDRLGVVSFELYSSGVRNIGGLVTPEKVNLTIYNTDGTLLKRENWVLNSINSPIPKSALDLIKFKPEKDYQIFNEIKGPSDVKISGGLEFLKK